MILKETTTISAAEALVDDLTCGVGAEWAAAVQAGKAGREVYYVADADGMAQLEEWGLNPLIMYEREREMVDGEPVVTHGYINRRLEAARVENVSARLSHIYSEKARPEALPDGFKVGYRLTRIESWGQYWIEPDEISLGIAPGSTKWMAGTADGRFVAQSAVSGEQALHNVRRKMIRREGVTYAARV